ncbi:hypothetical protein EIN_339010 [Entamoeba invadens IP1]|uniref:EGF-like domain-containing protein n=1 Tax=Entamoeba invadens IP1 TaxID=370355 RepID=A0A0A1UAM3_ENTIV|nr:hypothetical protein EIN_339010 [Entamoeba invadens IP1]ELP90250.1 hypothetical protein EIN_339010 [Entamoeba invadens IP1]|eukprot:XP_004257021.1 hypothetical protein EIN_339010 [Entamoeba invadens IP1]
MCQNNNYPENGICHSCTLIPNCQNCSSIEKICTVCVGDFLITNGECICRSGFYLNEVNGCSRCYERIENCKICYQNNNEIRCQTCYEPYVVDANGTCTLCKSDKYYYNNNFCVFLDTNCEIQTSELKCLKCQQNNYLINQNCISNIEDVNCKEKSLAGCQECSNGISINNYCENSISNCKYILSTNSDVKSKCFQCTDNYILFSNKTCNSVNNDILSMRNNVVYLCDKNGYIDMKNKCQNCFNNNTTKCKLFGNQFNAIQCVNNSILNIEDKSCFYDNNCVTISSNDCVKCNSNSNYYISDNKCVLNVIDKCDKCHNNSCVICSVGYLLQKGVCQEMSVYNCVKSNGFSCLQCVENYSRNNTTIDQTYCTQNDNQIKYSITNFNNKIVILECTNTNYLWKQNCFLITSYTSFIKFEKTIKKEIIDNTNCEIMTSKGCLKCIDMFYLNTTNNECLPCVNSTSNCLSCSNSTHCLTCKTTSYFLNKENKCELISELETRCIVMLPSRSGCVTCKDGYYSGDCLPCNSTCKTCQVATKCLSCQENFFKIGSDTSLCISYDLLLN